MEFTKSPATFFVEEIMHPQLGGGRFFYYILEKHGIDSFSAVKLLEEHNKTHVSFAGAKDANATTRQWISSIKELKSPDTRMALEFKGMGEHRIYTGMHSANRFDVKFGNVDGEETDRIKMLLKKSAFPNYFDEQRLSPATVELAQALLGGKWEDAAKAALGAEGRMQSEKSKKIRQIIRENWGSWKKLIDDPQVPESKKGFFRLLLAGGDFKSALPELERNTISIACRTAQALIFNEALAKEISKQNARDQRHIEIAQGKFPVKFSYRGTKRGLKAAPVYPRNGVLERKTYFEAKHARLSRGADGACLLSFELKKGCYGTILLKCLQAIID